MYLLSSGGFGRSGSVTALSLVGLAPAALCWSGCLLFIDCLLSMERLLSGTLLGVGSSMDMDGSDLLVVRPL